MSRPAPEECANCGASIPPRAKACPECGADEHTGWREQSIYDGLDLPDEAWTDDHAEHTAERPRAPLRSPTGLAWYWWALAVLLLFCLGFAVLGLA